MTKFVLPPSWTTVTPLSKGIALVVVTVLPVLAFFLGRWYQVQVDRLSLLPVVEYETFYNDGVPDTATAPENLQPAPSFPPVDWSNIKTFTDSRNGIKFDYIADATMLDAEDEGRMLEKGFDLVRENLDPVSIVIRDNPKMLTAKQWFASERSNFHPSFISESVELPLLEKGTISVAAQPQTCMTAGLIYVFVALGDKVYIITQYDATESEIPRALQLFLSNLYINGGDTKIEIPLELLQYPPAPTQKLDCPQDNS